MTDHSADGERDPGGPPIPPHHSQGMHDIFAEDTHPRGPQREVDVSEYAKCTILNLRAGRV